MYTNERCSDPAESCAKWRLSGGWVEGCLGNQYCGKRGSYNGKGEVLFLCPDDTPRGNNPQDIFQKAEDLAEKQKVAAFKESEEMVSDPEGYA